MRPLKRILFAAVGLALAGLAVFALMPQPVTVELARVSRGELKVSVQGAGKTRVRDRYVVLAPASGRLERVGLRAGDPVAAGAPLAYVAGALPTPLDARSRAEASARVAASTSAQAEALAQVERCRVALSLARLEAQRARTLAKSQAVSEQALSLAEHEALAREKELSLAERTVERAQRETDAARAVLVTSSPGIGGSGAGAAPGERIALTAPAAGVVLRVLREDEGPVAAGTPVLEVGDPSSLEAVLDLLTSQAARVRPGAPADLEQWGGRGALKAKVSVIEPSGFTKLSALGVEEQRVNVLLDPAAAGAFAPLGDGYHVEGRILVYQRADALKVPAGALFRHGGEWAAFLVDGGRAAIRPVQAGESNGEEVEILAGLSEGERVVVHPGDQVKAGVKVRPL
ncbi:MAG TPA: HlyD family efflux transporter periplasmic adaptor subunit [Myxococcales bacterium]|jgi:HlyD family secretion protein